MLSNFVTGIRRNCEELLSCFRRQPEPDSFHPVVSFENGAAAAAGNRQDTDPGPVNPSLAAVPADVFEPSAPRASSRMGVTSSLGAGGASQNIVTEEPISDSVDAPAAVATVDANPVEVEQVVTSSSASSDESSDSVLAPLATDAFSAVDSISMTSSQDSVAPNIDLSGEPVADLETLSLSYAVRSTSADGRTFSQPSTETTPVSPLLTATTSAPGALGSASALAAERVNLGVKIRKPENSWNLKSEKKGWTSTYWPYSDVYGDGFGTPTRHLWAKSGCLDKLDELRVARGMEAGARAHEMIPALNFLKNDGTASGYYIPAKIIREEDAEVTTGVDFTESGVLNKDAKFDFLNDHKEFGKNGRTDGRLNVAWWGSCDKVALAGILFDCPKRNVTIEGITFTINDIKGLLALIATGQSGLNEYCGWKFWDRPDKLTLKDGTLLRGRATNVGLTDCLRGSFERDGMNGIVVRSFKMSKPIEFEMGSESKVIDPTDVKLFEREDEADPAASKFHTKVKNWLREGRPFAMDKDSGSHLWNIGVDEAEIDKTRTPPEGVDVTGLVGARGPYGGGDLCFYDAELRLNSKRVGSYSYWIEKDGSEHINSGWISHNPAFLWRPESIDVKFEGRNERNPFVEPALVKEIYLQSLQESE